MRVVALISGGKDSCYNMMQCVAEGHEIVALANLYPKDKDELDSYMYQTVGHHAIELYAEAMSLPLYRRMIQGSSREIGRYYSPTADDEVEDLYELLKLVMREENVDSVSSGAILSDYQRVRVENVCQRLGLVSLAYLWRRNQEELMKEMIKCQVEAVLIKVAALGLEPKKHLGKYLSEIYPHMQKKEAEFGLHICGEGGEFETFTLDCPLFKKKLVIDETETVIHSEDAFAPVGYLNLKKMHLEDKPVTKCSTREFLHSLPMKRGSNLLSELFNEEEKRNLELDSQPQPCVPVSSPEQIVDVDTVQTWISDKWFSVSGVAGIHLPGETTEDTTRRVMDKLCGRVKSLGRTMADLISVCLYVHNMADFSQVNSVYKTYFSINPPIRVCVQAANPSNVSLLLDCQGYVCSDDSKVKDTLHVQSISHWASSNIGPYSQATQIYHRLYTAGQIALCPASMNLIGGGIKPESRLSLRHLWRVLTAMHPGISPSNLTCVICYVTSPSFIQSARQEWRQFVKTHTIVSYGEEPPSHEPLLQLLVVPHLPRDAAVEWQAEAYTGPGHLMDHFIQTSISDSMKISIKYCHSVEDSESSVFSCKVSIECQGRDHQVFKKGVVEMFSSLSQVLHKLSLTWSCVHLCRVFYPVSYIQYSQLYTVLSEAVKSLKEASPVFSLVPVTSLATEGCILSLCC